MTKLTFQSIADTGTTLLLLPPAATKDYYANVTGATMSQKEGGWIFPCNSLLPDLTVQMLGDVTAVIPGTYMNRSVSQTPGSTSCYGGIQQGSATLSIWGDVFLKSQFVVFDGSVTPRIGFAKQNSGFNINTPPSSPAPPVSPPPTAPAPTSPPATTTISIPGVIVPGPGPIMTLGPVAPVAAVSTKDEKGDWMMGLFLDLATVFGMDGGVKRILGMERSAESNGVIGQKKKMVGRFRFEDVE